MAMKYSAHKSANSIYSPAAFLAAGAFFGLTFSVARALSDQPPPPGYLTSAPAASWTGFYAGLNAGYGWDASPNVYTTAAPLLTRFDNLVDLNWGYAPGSLTHAGASALASTGVADTAGSGGIGGGQIGYNFQFNNFVAGLEADIQSARIAGRGSFAGAALAGVNVFGADTALTSVEHAKSLDWLGTVRGRLGYLVTPTLLAYVTGGLAYGGVSASTNIHEQWSGPAYGSGLRSSGAVGHFSDTRVGWTLGGGLEWMFAQNLSLKAEYLYYDLGSAQWTSSPATSTYTLCAVSPCNVATYFTNAVVAASRTRFDGHIARVGLNYHFSPFGFAPVPVSIPSPVMGWTGFYAGLNAGYAWDASPNVYTAGTPLLSNLGMSGLDWGSASALSATGAAGTNGSGGLAGGQLGYNRQFNNFVAGLEADIQSVHMRGRGAFSNAAQSAVDFLGTTYTDTSMSSVEHEKTVDWLGTVRGRLGYLVTPTLLAYATGGLAYGGVTARAGAFQVWSGNFLAPSLQTSGAAGRFSDTLVGWTAGGGFEWMFAPQVSLKGEYLYYDLGRWLFSLHDLPALHPCRLAHALRRPYRPRRSELPFRLGTQPCRRLTDRS
jgi:outer membrane immunogenic protein